MKNLYNNISIKFVTFLLCLFLVFNISNIHASSYTLNKMTFGKDSLKHIEYLSKTPRISGTKLILNSQKYIKNEFQKYGYNVEEQNFVWPLENNKKISKNIIAFKKGLNNKQIIIGAHYDSTNCNGADDNASGVSVLLELAQKLNKLILPYNIKFIAFDAEEMGLFGSRYFVKNMTSEEKSNTLLYINIDSILSGDNLYIYGDYGSRGWFRDEILDIALKENIEIKTSPGLKNKNENSISILEGECFDYSDHVYFRHEGIPFAYFESTNWDSINKQTGYPNYRNSDLGMVLHSNNDDLNFIIDNLKNKPINNLAKCISLLYKTLTYSNKKITIITNTKNTEELKNIKYELYKNNSLIETFSHSNSNKIIISNLNKGTYKIKQINDSNLKFNCNMNEKYFEISDTGNINILYEDINAIPKSKDYDGILIGIYGENFNDPQTSIDELYKKFIKIKNIDSKAIYNKEFSIDEIKKTVQEHEDKTNDTVPTFSNITSDNSKFLSKNITKIITSILLTFLYSNIYSIQKSKSI